MAERTALMQRAQIGIEVTPGTPVAATRRLQSLDVTMGPKLNVRMTRPSGYKVATIAAPGKEWVEGRAQGQLTYTEVVHLLASVYRKVTPTQINGPSGLAYRWRFDPAVNAEEDFQTYTLERGSAVRGERAALMFFNGVAMKFDRETCDLSGPYMAQAMEDPFTLTTTGLTDIPLVPVLGTEVAMFVADTYAGLSDDANRLRRSFSAEYTHDGLREPLWVLDDDQASFVAVSEKAAAPKLRFTVEADAAGMAFLPAARAGDTKFVRIRARRKGAPIDATPATPYSLTLDMAIKFTGISDFKDEQAVVATDYDCELVYDAGWGHFVTIDVVNTLTAL
jgi:hypothetical protein